VGEEAGRRLILSRRGSGMALQVSLTLLNESKQAAELMQHDKRHLGFTAEAVDFASWSF